MRFSHLLLFFVSLLLPFEVAKAEQRYECLIEPWKIVRVGARSTGILSALHIDRADTVTSGQEIARLNSEIEAASLRLAEERANSTIRIELAQARADYEKLVLARAQTLFERDVVSEQELDTALASFKVAELQVDEAAYQKDLAALERERAQALYDLRTIVSPLNGVVVSTDRALGEFLSDDDNVATIAQIDPLKVQAFLPLDMIGKVRVGDTVRVFPQVPAGGQYEGVVDVVDKVVDARSATIGIRVRLPNPEGLTLAGLRCELTF